MRLPQRFYRLPVRFDADRLCAEAAALPAQAWVPHPNGDAGNSAVRLISVDGGENDEVNGIMRMTPHLERSPYLRQVLAGFGVVWSRSRLLRLAPGAVVPRARRHSLSLVFSRAHARADRHAPRGAVHLRRRTRAHGGGRDLDLRQLAPASGRESHRLGAHSSRRRHLGQRRVLGARGAERAGRRASCSGASTMPPAAQRRCWSARCPGRSCRRRSWTCWSSTCARSWCSRSMRPTSVRGSPATTRCCSDSAATGGSSTRCTVRSPSGWEHFAKLRDAVREQSRLLAPGLALRTNRVSAHRVFEARILRACLTPAADRPGANAPV